MQREDKVMVDASPRGTDEAGSSTRPVIVDLGKKTRKAIKKLKRGTGDTMLEVEAAIREARQYLSDADKNKPTIPIVLIYERRRGRKRVNVPLLPLPSPFNLFR
jgi:hypothetical protein